MYQRKLSTTRTERGLYDPVQRAEAAAGIVCKGEMRNWSFTEK
jgi:hypothetical protein